MPALLGLTAVQEFVLRGRGTPVPFDPPRRLVTTDIYAYVRNPMQLSAVLLLFLSGAVLQNAWVAAAGVMAPMNRLTGRAASWAWKPWRAPSSTFTVDGRCSES